MVANGSPSLLRPVSRVVGLAAAILFTMARPESGAAGVNEGGRIRLSFAPDANIATLEGAPQHLLLVYCRIDNAPDLAGLGVKLRWNPRARSGCYRQVNPPRSLDCGRVVVDQQPGQFGGEDYEHRIVFPNSASRGVFAFAFRMTGCQEPPPTTFFIEQAIARDSAGDLDQLHVTGAIHVAGGRLPLPIYEIPEYLSLGRHVASLNRHWSRVVGTQRILRRPDDNLYFGEPASAALSVLTNHASQLGVAGSLGHLGVSGVNTGFPAVVVKIQQHVEGVPVLDAGLRVVLSHDRSLIRVVNRYIPHASHVSPVSSVSAAQAADAARNEIGLPPFARCDGARLVVYPMKDEAILTWQVSMDRWSVFVDAQSVRVVGVSKHPANEEDAPARIWIPNPRVAVADTTFPGGLGSLLFDRPDTTCTYPAGVYQDVVINDVTEATPNTFWLNGPRVSLTYEADSTIAFTSPAPSPDFRTFRCVSNAPPVPDPEVHFAQVMAYYFVDNVARHLYENIGLERYYSLPDTVDFRLGSIALLRPFPLAVVLGDYSCEDAELILHEYAHLFHKDQNMGDDLNNSTTESKSLSEGGVASFVALCMLAHQPRDGAAPFEFLGVEWGPGGGFEGTGKYIRNNTLYPWHWTTSGGYKNGNIFGNALWDIFDGLEGLPGYGTCPDISPSSFLQNCAARDTLLVRLAYGLRATAGNQSFRTVAEAMLEGDYLAGGSNLRMMLDAFDSHGWFFTRYDTTYGIQFRPVIIPADADSAIRTLALHLHSHTGVKPDSVFVHYNAISQEPVVQLMTYDPDLGAHVAFMDVEAYTFENNHIHYLVSAVNQVNGPSAPGVTVYWPKNAPADTTANFWYGDRLSRLHFASTQEETIPAGQERTLTLGVAAPSSIVLDVNVNIRIENDGHLIPEADWFLEAPGGSRVTLVRNLFKDHVSWPDFFDVWFDDELDAPCESFIPWDFSGPTYTPPSLATFDSLDVEGTWKLIINNNVGGAEPIVVSQWGLQFRTEPFPVIGIDEVESRPARHSMVGDPIPNPFNPITLFPVYLESPALVQFRIYDVAGRLVRELVNERMYQGEYTVKWDGHDEGGIPASSGVYFYRVTLGDRAFTGKSVLIK